MDSSLEETKDKLIKKKRNHILKRIKKHFGIVRRNSNPCLTQNNLPPLQFHLVHGDNIRISRDGTLARRFESFCRALTFSARPVRINERILVRFSEISNNWNGGIRFGFTSNDPVTLENSLPKYACPDLTNRPGFWAKALHEQYCDLNNVLHYYINSTGDVIYGINGEEKGVILSGIDVRGLIWTVIDVYGNCTAIELLDARLFKQQTSSRKHAIQGNNQSDSLNCLVTPLHFLSFLDDDACLPPLQYNMHKTLIPLPFHRTKGRNIMLSTDCMVATRTKTDFCQGYIFTSLPIQIDEILVIQILKTDSNYKGALALGLTSCNPTSLQQYDFPDDCIFLLDRPEYWVLTKDIGLTSNRGDEISVFITPNGEVSISKNGARSALVMHIDHRLELWAFLDIYGSTQSVRMFRQPMGSNVHSMISVLSNSTNISQAKKKSSNFSACRIQTISSSTLDSPIKDNAVKPSPISTNLENLLDPISTDRNVLPPPVGQTFVPSSNEMIREGGTVLVVNLPPTTSRSQESCYRSDSSRKTKQSCESFSNLSFSGDKIQFKNPSLKNNSLNQFQSENKNKQKETLASECTICYEKTIDSVLYMCGHMCMCYECAIEQWQGAGDGQCPLCRAIIRDVIRTYIT